MYKLISASSSLRSRSHENTINSTLKRVHHLFHQFCVELPNNPAPLYKALALLSFLPEKDLCETLSTTKDRYTHPILMVLLAPLLPKTLSSNFFTSCNPQEFLPLLVTQLPPSLFFKHSALVNLSYHSDSFFVSKLTSYLQNFFYDFKQSIHTHPLLKDIYPDPVEDTAPLQLRNTVESQSTPYFFRLIILAFKNAPKEMVFSHSKGILNFSESFLSMIKDILSKRYVPKNITTLILQYFEPCSLAPSCFSTFPFTLGSKGYVLQQFLSLKSKEIKHNLLLIEHASSSLDTLDSSDTLYIRYYYAIESQLYGVYFKPVLENGKLFGLTAEEPEPIDEVRSFQSFQSRHTAFSQWVQDSSLIALFKSPKTHLIFNLKQLYSISQSALFYTPKETTIRSFFWDSICKIKHKKTQTLSTPTSIQSALGLLTQAVYSLSSGPGHFQSKLCQSIFEDRHAMTLFPSQKEMLQALLSSSGELGYPILSGPPGSGKTLSALLFFTDKLLSGIITKPILIIGSSISLNSNWKNEIESYILPLDGSLTVEIFDKKNISSIKSSFVVVCSKTLQSVFKTLSLEEKLAFPSCFGGMIVDEAHHQLSTTSSISDSNVSVTQILFYLRTSLAHTLVLTATPSPDNILQFMTHFYLAYFSIYSQHPTTFSYIETLYDSIYHSLFVQLSSEEKICDIELKTMPLFNDKTELNLSYFIQIFRQIPLLFYFGKATTSSVEKRHKTLCFKDDPLLPEFKLPPDESDTLHQFLCQNLQNSEIELYPKLILTLLQLPSYKKLIYSKLKKSLSKGKKICISVSRIDLAETLRTYISTEILTHPDSVEIYTGETSSEDRLRISQTLKNRVSYDTLKKPFHDAIQLELILKLLHEAGILIPLQEKKEIPFSEGLSYYTYPYFRITHSTPEELNLSFKPFASSSNHLKIYNVLKNILLLRVVIVTPAGFVGVSFDTNTLIKLQLDWSPSQSEQITGRIGRADGRGHKKVSIYEIPLPSIVQLLMQKYMSYKNTLNSVLKAFSSGSFSENDLTFFLNSLSRSCLIEKIYYEHKYALKTARLTPDSVSQLYDYRNIFSLFSETLSVIDSDKFQGALRDSSSRVFSLASSTASMNSSVAPDWSLSGALVRGKATLRAIPGIYKTGSVCDSDPTMPDIKLVVPMRLPSPDSPDKSPLELITTLLNHLTLFHDHNPSLHSRLEFFIGLNCKEGSLSDDAFIDRLNLELEKLKSCIETHPFPFSVSLFGVSWSNEENCVPFGALRNHLIYHAKQTLSEHPNQLLLSMDADTVLTEDAFLTAFDISLHHDQTTLRGGSFGYRLSGDYFNYVNQLSFEIRQKLEYEGESLCYPSEPLLFFSGNLASLPDSLFNTYGLDGRGVQVAFNEQKLKLTNPLSYLTVSQLPCVENVSRFKVEGRSEIAKLAYTLEQPCNPRTFANQIAFFFGVSFGSVNRLMTIINPYSLVKKGVSLKTISSFLSLLKTQSTCFTTKQDLSSCFDSPSTPITLETLLGSSPSDQSHNFSILSTHTKLQLAFRALIDWADIVTHFLSSNQIALDITDTDKQISLSPSLEDTEASDSEDRFESWGLRNSMSVSGHLQHTILDTTSQFKFSFKPPPQKVPPTPSISGTALDKPAFTSQLDTFLSHPEREFAQRYQMLSSAFKDGPLKFREHFIQLSLSRFHEFGAISSTLSNTLETLYHTYLSSKTLVQSSSPTTKTKGIKRSDKAPLESDSKRIMSRSPFDFDFSDRILKNERQKHRFLELQVKLSLDDSAAKEILFSKAESLMDTFGLKRDVALVQALTLLLES